MASVSPPPHLRASRRFELPLPGVVAAACLLLLVLTLSAPAVHAQQQTPAAPAAPDPTLLFNNALTSFGRGDYAASVTAIETLLKQIPADMPAADKAKLAPQLEPIYFTLGAAYFNLQQYPEAVTAIDDYLKRYPKSARAPDAAFSLAQANYFAKDYAHAAEGFAALENSPAFREQALLFEGLSYREDSQDAKAIAALEKLTAGGIKSPTAARGGMQLIFLYGRQNQPDKALKMLSSVEANIDQLDDVVDLNDVALKQGDAYLESGSNANALVCYRAIRTREQVVAIENARIATLQKELDANKTAAKADPRQALRFLTANKQISDTIAADQHLAESFGKLPTIYPKVLYRIGRAFYQMGRQWESIVAYQDSFDRSQDPADREPALFGIVTAYVDVNQPDSARQACDQYLKEFPQGTNASTVGYLLGATALQQNDSALAERYFGRMLAEQPASTLREEMRFLLANAQFAQGEFEQAKGGYRKYQQDFPQGTHFEEAVYRVALADLFSGKYDEASNSLDDYLKRYPAGNFVSDAKYRRDVCKYAMNKYDEVIADCQAWLKEYPGDAQQGEVRALLGDAFTATDKPDDALAAYQASFKTATTDEVLNYSLTEAGKILQKRGDWEADAAMFTDFVHTHPDSPTVVVALSQIGRAKTKEGKVDEAKQIFADTLKKYIDDCHRGSVEQILDQLAALCVRKKPAPLAAVAPVAAAPGGSPAGSPLPVAAASPQSPADPGAELDNLLGASLADRSPVAQARILYAKAELAQLRRQPADAECDLLAIASKFRPDVLSATILGQVGDVLLAKGRLNDAAPYYQALLETYPKDDNVDFAYAGLGEIAFQKKEYEKALGYFQDGTDKVAANQKLKDLTVGQAKTLLAMGRLDEAKKIFEQAASVHEWRGETTAFCMYSLGEIEAKKGHWAEANAYYQRVYVAYQRFLPWVAKAYLGSADSLEKLGKKEDAVKTYQEMLRNTKLADFGETNEARQRLQALGSG